MYRTARLVGSVLVALLLGLSAGRASPTQAQAKLCFGEVPDCIEGRFAEYWQQNGGLPVFGFPIGPARLESVGGGQLLVQPFERNRFELHPENARPYDVLLGRLGDDRLRQLGRPWEAEPKAAGAQAGCQLFGETGHQVCEPFLGYWRSHGLALDARPGFTAAESLALFGLPLTEARPEVGSDGKEYLTQWFERARFELHPEVGPGAVLLGLLGREVGAPPAPQPPAPPPPAPPAADTPASVNATVSPLSGPPGTTFTARAFGFERGERVGVYTTGPDQSVFGAPFQVEAGADGATSEVMLTLGSSADEGVYTMTFEGTSSGRKAFAYFRVTAAPPPSGDTAVPPSQSALVEPPTGRPGTEFMAIGFGFRPGERVGVYVTAPDQRVIGAPFQVGADGAGGTEPVFFETSRDAQPGVWAFTFEGISSGHRAVAYFRVLP